MRDSLRMHINKFLKAMRFFAEGAGNF